VASRDLIVNILADTTKLNQALDNAGKKMSKWGTAAKVAGAAFVAGFATDKVVDFLGSAVGAAQEANKILAQTEAVIKSTGGAAGVTAKQVDDLAASIAAKTGIDDEAIATGENLLLTFTNLKNEAGDGNDIFNQTTKVMVDMAAAMGTDASASAIQLGKAMNDPIAGISALTRVGVTFTDQQKAQIKAMVEAGDVAGAQKIILAELNKEFGGSAEAQATAAGKMSVAWGNIQEQIGGLLVPALEEFATIMSETVLPAISEAVEWIQANWPKISATIKEDVDKVMGYITPVLETLTELWKRFGDDIINVVRGAFDFIAGHIQVAVALIKAIVQPIISLLHGDWSKAWHQFKEQIGEAWDGIKQQISGAIGIITGMFGGLISAVGELPGKIASAAVGMWNGIVSSFKSAINAVLGFWNSIEFKIPGFKVGPVGFDGFTLGVPDIPLMKLAKGGIVNRPTLALIGESGPEAVIPLGNAGAGGGAVNIYGPVYLQTDMSEEDVVRKFNNFARKNGGVRTPGGVMAVS